MIFSVNSILRDEITKIDNTFLPNKFRGDINETRKMQDELQALINLLGTKSTKAQKLKKVLTTSDKLKKSNDVLYLLKDSLANEDNGRIIGLLRVGVKSLYLYDQESKVHNVNPLCVLDFYVIEEYQKTGCGKRLFDFMLADQNKQVDEIAIDSPSKALQYFLRTRYNVETLVIQSNNFAITKNFFEVILKNPISAAVCGRISPVCVPGRFAYKPPPSQMREIINGQDRLMPVILVNSPEQHAEESYNAEALHIPEASTSLPLNSTAAPISPKSSGSSRKQFPDSKNTHTKLW